MKILLDMGHCLSVADTGAQGNGKKEQDCTREIGYKVKSKLESLGHTVIICSIDSANNLMESLNYRVNTANKNTGDIFISIHLNAGGGYGTEIFTYGGKHLPEADRILSEFVALGLKNRGIKDGSGLYVIRNTEMESMLVECCFMDTNDMNLYNAELFSNAIVKGLTGELPVDKVAPIVQQTTKKIIERKVDNMNIKDLQRFCNKIGAIDYEGKALIEDGLDGKRTQSAKVKAKAILQYVLA